VTAPSQAGRDASSLPAPTRHPAGRSSLIGGYSLAIGVFGDFAESEDSKGDTTMTNPKAGNEETNTHTREEPMNDENRMISGSRMQRISFLAASALTTYLAYRAQYFYALCSLALTLASATADRLKKIRIGLKGLHLAWNEPSRAGLRRMRKRHRPH
jgi:hypothetical protein